MKTRRMLIPFALGLGLAGAVLWLLCGGTAPATAAPVLSDVLSLPKGEVEGPECQPLQAPGDVITVCLSGGCDYTSVQAAVDAANDGDVIKVAAGVYTDIHQRSGITQVVYISKTVTIRGGYTTNWTTPDPETNPTTLDALGQGRVLYITGDISPTIEGLRITGGDAGSGDGGGVYVITATATISNCMVYSNTASTGLYSYGCGGGLYLLHSAATLSDNTVQDNTAGIVWYSDGGGGGLYLDYSDATLNDNTIIGNTAAGAWSGGDGGGLYLYHSNATLSGNTISGNTATSIFGGGGGLCLYHSNATLGGNTISGNTANNGGGLYLSRSDATLSSNTISSNTADFSGGGLYLSDSDATLSGNTISGNTLYGFGGGLYLRSSDATLSSNIVFSNTAGYDGGGLYLYLSDATMDNNFIMDNVLEKDGNGSGLYMGESSPQLRHNTIARNHGGGGEGLYVIGASSRPQLYNTILVSHTVGITITDGNTVTLEATLWGTDTWANKTDWGGAGTILTGTVNVWGDPAFVDPANGDYHIGPSSAAVDAGVSSGVFDDVDGEPRPAAFGPDIGADERPGVGLQLHKWAWQDIRNPGQIVTYTLVVTSVGTGPVEDVILTDTLPLKQRVIASATDTGTCTTVAAPIWGGGITCALGTLDVGEGARITLTAQITTTLPPILPWPMRNRVWVAGTQASDFVYADVYLQDCHVRINDDPTEYTTVQAAVDAASPGDLVKVAGFCVGASEREGLRQQVYLDKGLTIRGGYTTANWTTPDPDVNLTTLDALGQGRVLYITGDISPTVEGLRITGGDATGLGGDPWDNDTGGGMYIITATATISNNRLFGNTADRGGGLYLSSSDATLGGNTVSGNTAESYGGGLYLHCSNATLSGNVVGGNTVGWGGGGGLYLYYSDATLSGNAIFSNTAGRDGGGLYLLHSAATLSGNTASGNTANYHGGGLYLVGSDGATLDGNTITSNTAGWDGGGLYLRQSDAILTNNVVADNQANNAGSGLYIEGSSFRLMHTTIAHNSGGDGSGIYVTKWGPYNTVAFTNTILVSHTVGITITAGNTATLEATLWGTDTWANTTDWGGAGAIITGTHNYWGNPAFVDPDAGNYHIGLGSAAIDKGVDAGVTVDIDGEPRPFGTGYDIGADEFLAALSVTKRANPDPVQAGAQLTYTIRVTNTGNVALHATVADTLPAQVTPTGTLTWTLGAIAPGGVWTEQFSVTVEIGYAGPLTNVVQVTTEEGATGVYTETSQAQVTPALSVTKRANADPVQAGAQLTYTIRVTNTGNVALHATITDTLPAHVTPTETLTWTPTVTAPDGVWTEQVVVTVAMGYVGPLINVVQVTTEEGATGVYTEVSTVSNQAPYTPTNSIPTDFATDVPITQTLRWQGGDPDGHPVTYTVAFGASDPPPFATTTTLTTYTPTLIADTTYYWGITASDGISVSVGDTWRFTTVGFKYIYLPLVLRQ